MTDHTTEQRRTPRNAVLGGAVAAAITATILAIGGYEAWMTSRHAHGMQQCMERTGDRKACMDKVRSETPLPQPRRMASW